MSKSVYALVSYRDSPIAITSPKVVRIYESRDEAKKEALRLSNSNRTQLDYWVERVEFVNSHREQK